MIKYLLIIGILVEIGFLSHSALNKDVELQKSVKPGKDSPATQPHSCPNLQELFQPVYADKVQLTRFQVVDLQIEGKPSPYYKHDLMKSVYRSKLDSTLSFEKYPWLLGAKPAEFKQQGCEMVSYGKVQFRVLRSGKDFLELSIVSKNKKSREVKDLIVKVHDNKIGTHLSFTQKVYYQSAPFILKNRKMVEKRNIQVVSEVQIGSELPRDVKLSMGLLELLTETNTYLSKSLKRKTSSLRHKKSKLKSSRHHTRSELKI